MIITIVKIILIYVISDIHDEHAFINPPVYNPSDRSPKGVHQSGSKSDNLTFEFERKYKAANAARKRQNMQDPAAISMCESIK